MKRLRTGIRSAAVAVAVLTLNCLAVSQPADAAAGPQIGPFAVAPAPNNAGQLRPFFQYTEPAGGTVRDRLQISNLGDIPLTFDLFAADAINLGNGAFTVQGQSAPKKGVGAWVTLAVKTVTVPGHARDLVPYALSVPLDATPGDHAGGIVALLRPPLQPPQGHSQATTRQGVGARIYLRVPGALHPGLAVTALSVDDSVGAFGGGTARIRAVVVNTGNMMLNAVVHMRVTGPLGSTAKVFANSRIESFLPGSRVQVDKVWPDLPLAGPYHVSISVTSPATRAAGSYTVWIVPWAVVVILALLVALFAWYRWDRRRRRREDAGPAPRSEATKTAVAAGP